MDSKKHVTKRIMAMALAGALAVSTVSVPAAPKAEAAAKKYVKSLKVAKTKKTVKVGKSVKVKVTVKVANKASAKFTVKSSKKAVATAKVSGKKVVITGKKAGTAVITVTSKAKNKKGKKISKKITVTVKKAATTAAPTTAAPTTAAPTTAAPTTAAPTTAKPATTATPTTEAPKLSKITVTAESGKIAEKGGQTKLNVVGDPADVKIVSYDYESSNDQLASVSKDGVVTGINPGNVIIKVTATDANGNKVEGTVSIEVTKADEVKISVAEGKDKISIAPGKTETIAPIVTGSNDYVLEWKSSDEKVATVDDKGVVTAVAEGSATITATVKGSTASVAVAVTVKKNTEIAEFKATGAKKLTVTLTTPVTEEDQKKLKITLLNKTSGKNMELTPVWNKETNASFTFENKDNFTPNSTYVVTISSDNKDVSLGEKLTAEVTVEAVKPTSIKVDRQSLPYWKGKSEVHFDVLDQYGESMKYTNNKIDWSVKSDKASVNLKEMLITKDLGDKTYFNLDMDVLFNSPNDKNFIPGTDKIRLIGTLKEDPSVTFDDYLSVDYVIVNSIVAGEIDTNKNDMFQSSEAFEIYLGYTGTDDKGGQLDLESYRLGAYNSDIEFSLKDDNGIILADPTHTMSSEKTDNALYCKGKIIPGVIIKDGKLAVTIAANKAGTAVLTAYGNDGKRTSWTIEVKKSRVPNAVTIEATQEVEALGEIDIPVTLIDQYGDTIAAKSVSEDVFNAEYNVVASGIATVQAKMHFDDAKGYHVTVNTSMDDKDEELTGKARQAVEDGGVITLRFQRKKEAKESECKITVKKAAVAKTVDKVKDAELKPTLKTGEKTSFKFVVLGTYEKIYNGQVYFDIASEKCDIESVTAVKDDGSTETVNGSDGKYNATGAKEFTVNITAKSQIATGGKVSVQLYDKASGNNDRQKLGSALEYAFEVIAWPTKVAVTTSTKELVAGENLTVTLVAQDDSNNNVNKYNETFKNVTVEQLNSTTVVAKQTLDKVEFVNGKAEILVKAVKAGENQNFRITLKNFLSNKNNYEAKAEQIKVKTGAVAEVQFTAVSGDATKAAPKAGNNLSIAFVDSEGNVIEASGTKIVTVKVVSKQVDKKLDDNVSDNKYTFTANATNKLTYDLTFSNALEKDDEITIEVDGKKCTMKVVGTGN